MNHTFIKKIILCLCLLSFYPATHAAPNDTALQNAVLVHINKYRQHRGLPLLKMDNRIVKEAKKHSQDMANHTQPFGHQLFMNRISRLKAQMKHSGGAAENVAYNYRGAEDVVKNWLLSPGHKRNIDGHYRLTGIGVARDKHGSIYFTQIFMA